MASVHRGQRHRGLSRRIIAGVLASTAAGGSHRRGVRARAACAVAFAWLAARQASFTRPRRGSASCSTRFARNLAGQGLLAALPDRVTR